MADQAGPSSRESLAALLRIFIKILAALALVFFVLRIISPSLMDLHNDLLFWAGVACWPLAAIIALLAVIWIVRDVRGLDPLPIPPKRLPDRD